MHFFFQIVDEASDVQLQKSEFEEIRNAMKLKRLIND